MTQQIVRNTELDHLFSLSQIKKSNHKNNLHGEQTTQKINYPSPASSNSFLEQHQQRYGRQNGQINESNLDNESSIDFQDGEQELEYDQEEDQQQIQFLQQQIAQKLTEQFSFVKQKLRLKQQQRQNLLRYFRQISTYRPEGLQNENSKNLNNHQIIFSHQKKIKNPLSTKKIKDKIVKSISDSNCIQTLKYQKVLNQLPKANIIENHSQGKHQNKRNIFINNIKIENFKLQKETPQFSKQNHQKNIIYRTNDDQFKLIQQLSEQLKKMQFKKIQDIAQGRFYFSKKK